MLTFSPILAAGACQTSGWREIPWRDASVTGLSTEDASTKYRRWCSGVGRAGFEDYSGTVVTCFM